MQNKIKILDLATAGVVFASAVNELISFWRCTSENYIGEVKGSDYLIYEYPLFSTIQGLLFALFLSFLICKFQACIYTRIVVIVFSIIQVINFTSLVFKINYEIYDTLIYPIFLFSIILLVFIKFLRWGSLKLS